MHASSVKCLFASLVIISALAVNANGQSANCPAPSYNSATQELIFELPSGSARREFVIVSPGTVGKRRTGYKVIVPGGQTTQSAVDIGPNQYIDKLVEQWLWDAATQKYILVYQPGTMDLPGMEVALADKLFQPTRVWISSPQGELDALVISNLDSSNSNLENYMLVILYYENNQLVRYEYGCAPGFPEDPWWYVELGQQYGVEVNEADYPFDYGIYSICVGKPHIIADNNLQCIEPGITPAPGSTPPVITTTNSGGNTNKKKKKKANKKKKKKNKKKGNR